ncbi:helix-turn-helix transcriptional regulator [Kribbella sp. NPDC054772]
MCARRRTGPRTRRTVHRALAAATDPGQDPDRRAWHRAQGADGPDEEIAAELVSSADRARRRGGVAASAAFLQRSTALTPDPMTRSIRALAAAQASLAAGAFETALGLLNIAEQRPADELHQARVNLLRAQVTFSSGHSLEAPPRLLEAARRLEPLDLGLARDTYQEALAAAQFAGRFGGRTGIAQIARAAKTVPSATPERKRDLVYRAVSTLFADGHAAARTHAAEAMAAFATEDDTTDLDDLPWMWLAALLPINLWDDEHWHLLTARHLRIARELGDLNQLPLALHHRAMLNLYEGELTAAAALLTEVQTVSEATGAGLAAYGQIGLAAWRGLPGAGLMIAASIEDSEARGEGGAVTFGQLINAVLHNGLSEYTVALRSGLEATAYPAELSQSSWALPELIEAASRAGQPDAAADAYARLQLQAQACGTDWGLGVLARSTGLRSGGSAAEAAYQEAVERLGRTRMRMELARAHLVYGEWLRRERRREDARGELRAAHKLFAAAGAEAFAERAARQLAQAGQPVGDPRAGNGSARDLLTAQEAQIAELAGSGLTNVEIGTRLYLSRHTVDFHLRKIFTKLDITSRKQLRP